MPATMDLREATEATLAAYLTTKVSGEVQVIAGWPERPVTRDLETAQAVVSVAVIGQPRTITRAATYAREPTGDGPAVMHVGEWMAVVQVDVWADYKAVLDTMSGVLRDAMNPNIPWSAGILLPMTAYYNWPLGTDGVFVERPPNDEGDQERGLWRMTWDLPVTSDVLREFNTSRQDVIQLDTTTTVADNQATASTVTTEVEVAP